MSTTLTEHSSAQIVGFEVAEAMFSAYSRPVLLVGPSGQGKRLWSNKKASYGESVCGVSVITDSRAFNLKSLEKNYFNSSYDFVCSIEVLEPTSPMVSLDRLVSLLKSAPSNIKIVAHASWQAPQTLRAVCDAVDVPLLSDEMMLTVAEGLGLKEDEAAFAIKAANGIPGDILKSFDILRSRNNILKALECVRDDNYPGLNACITNANTGDVALLKSIERSVSYGDYVYFSESDIEPLRRIKVLMGNVLYKSDKATPEVVFAAVFTAAQHAFHGRV